MVVAIIDSVYTEASQEGHKNWIRHRAEVIAEIELFWLTPVSYTHLTLPTNREV